MAIKNTVNKNAYAWVHDQSKLIEKNERKHAKREKKRKKRNMQTMWNDCIFLWHWLFAVRQIVAIEMK